MLANSFFFISSIPKAWARTIQLLIFPWNEWTNSCFRFLFLKPQNCKNSNFNFALIFPHRFHACGFCNVTSFFKALRKWSFKIIWWHVQVPETNINCSITVPSTICPLYTSLDCFENIFLKFDRGKQDLNIMYSIGPSNLNENS